MNTDKKLAKHYRKTGGRTPTPTERAAIHQTLHNLPPRHINPKENHEHPRQSNH